MKKMLVIAAIAIMLLMLSPLMLVVVVVGGGAAAAVCGPDPTSQVTSAVPAAQGSAPVKEYLWSTLVAAGMSSAGAAGVMGNMQAESGFNLKADNGSHWGLVQWDSGRWANEGRLAKKLKLDRWSAQAQTSYLLKELRELTVDYPNTEGKTMLGWLRTVADPTLAAAKFHAVVERAPGQADEARQSYAREIFKEFKDTSVSKTATLVASSAVPGGSDVASLVTGLNKPNNSTTKLQPNTVTVLRIIEKLWPYYAKDGVIGGWREDPIPDHPSGQALDIMLRADGRTPQGVAEGKEIAGFLAKNHETLGVDYMMFRHQIWNKGTGWRQAKEYGSWTDNHMNHIHLKVFGDHNATGVLDGTPDTSGYQECDAAEISGGGVPNPSAGPEGGAILGTWKGLGNVSAPIRLFTNGGHNRYASGRAHSCTYSNKCMDLGTQQREPLYAMADGELTQHPWSPAQSGPGMGYGMRSTIIHKDGSESIYAHLDAQIGPSRTVRAGEMIALAGCSTGDRSRIPPNNCAKEGGFVHLHYEWSGLRDPSPIPGGDNPPFFLQWQTKCYQGVCDSEGLGRLKGKKS